MKLYLKAWELNSRYMLDLSELNKTWTNIIKNQDCKNDNQTMNYIRAIQYGKGLIKDITPEMLLKMPVENVDMLTKINELYKMIEDAQNKVFGPVLKESIKGK